MAGSKRSRDEEEASDRRVVWPSEVSKKAKLIGAADAKSIEVIKDKAPASVRSSHRRHKRSRSVVEEHASKRHNGNYIHIFHAD